MKHLKLCIGIAIAIVAVIVALSVVRNVVNTVHLDDYIRIEASGYDGYGRVKV